MFYPFVLMDQLAGNTLPDPYAAPVDHPPSVARAHYPIGGSRSAGSPDGTAAADAEVAAFFGHGEFCGF